MRSADLDSVQALDPGLLGEFPTRVLRADELRVRPPAERGQIPRPLPAGGALMISDDRVQDICAAEAGDVLLGPPAGGVTLSWGQGVGQPGRQVVFRNEPACLLVDERG